MRTWPSNLLPVFGVVSLTAPAAMAWRPAPLQENVSADKLSAGKASTDMASTDKAPADHKGKDAVGEDDQLDLPTSLPEGAVVPEVITVPPVRADVFAGRATALGRMAQCPKCSGSGVKVTRHRESQGHMKSPKIVETKDDCSECHGMGICPNPGRVSPLLDSFVALLGALPEDAPSTPKQLEKARQALERLGATGDLVAQITEEDCTGIAAERIPHRGEALSVTGVVGSPIPIGGGIRLFPVQVQGRALVLLRAPVINAAPVKGLVFAGGLCAGAVEGTDWRWGKSAVLDVGFIVPWKDAPYKGSADSDGDGKPDAAPASGGAAAKPASGSGK
jgi:hypothetical protein